MCNAFAEPATLDIQALKIVLNENAGAFYGAFSFNGINFTGLNFGDGSVLTGFTLSTNLAGLTTSNISFNSNSIAYNASGLSFVTSPYFIELDLTAAPAVPEPASLAIFGSALAGFGLLRRRRRKV